MRARTLSVFNRFTVFAALTALIVSAAYVTPAYAAGIVVNTAGDTVNANDGLCSLREAITAANTNTASGPAAGECAAGSGADTISFAGNYTITLAPALGQLPNVTSPITINGNGAANTVIRAHASPNTATTRVFRVDSAGNLTLNALTVRNGRCNGSCAVVTESGGGIFNLGTLKVTNSSISGNSASGLAGGIYNFGGTLTVTNSIISGNSANVGGSGISSTGTTTVTNSTFSGNTTPGGGSGISNSGTLNVTKSTFSGNSASVGGSGISNSGTLTVTQSTFSGNTTPGGGAGVSNSGTLNITNSTYSGNSAQFGGGIYQVGASATANVTNSTFSSNSAGSSGGGIFKDPGAGAITLKNTIVADSTAGGNCGGTITNGGNNLDSGATCGWGSNNNSQSNTDPKLGPLASNGGLTKTMALLAGSPAINTGTDAGCPATDQRGKPRPQGAHCDIGAYESPNVTTLRSGGAQDGWVLETSENSNQGGALNAAATTFLLGDNAGNRQYRSILHFDTASLPDNAIVARVTLKIRRQSVVGTNPFTTHLKVVVDIRQGAFGSLETLQATDFQALAHKPAVGVIANNPTATGWYATRLKATAHPFVNRTGVTQLRLRFQTDDDNDALADIIKFHSGNSTAANRPILVIEYYVP
jgi:CSLREA domain-containing protein